MPDGQIQQIDKETFMNADQETRWSMAFDMWSAVLQQTQNQASFCQERIAHCDAKYSSKTDANKSRLFAILGGFIGGLTFWAALFVMKLPV